MNLSFIVLCLAAFSITAMLVSGTLIFALPLMDRFATRLSERQRARLWLVVAAFPSVAATLAIGASLLPAIGIGHDHCLAHGLHHPHLCLNHLGSTPGIVLIAIALVFCLRVIYLLASLGKNVQRSRNTSSLLAEAHNTYEDAVIFSSETPQAFVLGTLRPRIHVSQGLLELGSDVVEPVLAHERVHAARRDLLWRALFPVLALGHLPSMLDSLRIRLCAAQEMAADAEAADVLENGRLRIAEALVLLARISTSQLPGVAFTHGDLHCRVHALLTGHRAYSAWPARMMLLCTAVLPVTVGTLHGSIHHALETLLGVLS